MTRKDFVLIAQTIQWARISKEDRQIVAEDFSRSLQSTNPNFDRERFIAAATDQAGISNRSV